MTPRRTRSHRFPFTSSIVGGALAVTLAAAAPAVAQDAPPADDAQAQLEELGNTLKAAVMSGSMTEREAMAIYAEMAARIGGEDGRKDAAGDKAAAKRQAAAAKRGAAPERSAVDRLMPRSVTDLTALLSADFGRRDIRTLVEELDLDADQSAILEVLVDDYRIAIDTAKSPLIEAIGRYDRAASAAWMADALVRAEEGSRGAEERTRARVESMRRRMDARLANAEDDADRARIEARFTRWTDEMLRATSDLETRLESIRARVAGEMAEMGGEGEVEAGDLLRLAEQLRADRTALRTGFTDSVAAISNDRQRGEDDTRLAAAFSRVTLNRDLAGGRFGGESMDLWATMQEVLVTGDSAATMAVAEGLRAATPEITTLMDARTEATLDREVAGIAALARRDRDEPGAGWKDIGGAPSPAFEAAARRELAASLAVRDEMLALLDRTAAEMDAETGDAVATTAFRDGALRRGFPAEMRVRWTERAVRAALRLDDLTDESRDAVLTIESETQPQLRELRERAVAERIRLDPTMARRMLDLRADSANKALADADAKDMDRTIGAMWRGLEAPAFDAIDDEAERRFRAALTPEQFERLPSRRAEKLAAGKNGGDDGKGNGKGDGDDWRTDPKARAAVIAEIEAAVAAGTLDRASADEKIDWVNGSGNSKD